jgi:hypothetical protein
MDESGVHHGAAFKQETFVLQPIIDGVHKGGRQLMLCQ